MWPHWMRSFSTYFEMTRLNTGVGPGFPFGGMTILVGGRGAQTIFFANLIEEKPLKIEKIWFRALAGPREGWQGPILSLSCSFRQKKIVK